MKELKLGIIGIGNMGYSHSENIYAGKIENLRLIAVCDIAPSKREKFKANFPDVLIFDDYKSLILSGKVDAILIATPHYLHPEIAVLAFEHGLNVLTEKPAGVRALDVEKMNEAAKKSGKTFGIMWNRRTNPLFKKAHDLVHSGAIGTPKKLIWIITNWYRSQSYYDSASWRATWVGEGGGVLLNQAPHNLDIWQWIFGMPDEVYATCSIGKYHNIEVEDEATILGFYKSGATATFITSTGEYPGTNRLEITGSKGKLVLEKGNMTLTLLDEDEREFCYKTEEGFPRIDFTEETISETTPGSNHNGILQNFTNAVLFGEELLAPGTEGLKEITLSNAAYLSSWTDKKVSLPLDNELFNKLLKEKIDNSHIREVSRTPAKGQSSRWQVKW